MEEKRRKSSQPSRPSHPSRPSKKDDSRNSRSDRPRSGAPKSDGKKSRGEKPFRSSGSSGISRPAKPSKPSSQTRVGRSDERPARSTNKTGGRGNGRSPSRGASHNRERVARDETPKRLEPEIPQEIYREELDPQFVRDLSSLASDNAEQTARHLLALVHFLAEDPERAHAHGVAASTRAARIGRVRELAGIAAYNAGKFDVALREFKTAFRITGDPSFWPMMADSQRGLGEPLKALEMGRAPEAKLLDKDSQVELRIVLSGARKDLGEFDAAVTALNCKELQEENGQWAARLRYAYADALAAAGKIDEAKKWFNKASSVDIDGETDAKERISQLS